MKGVDKGIWRRIKLIPFNVDLTDMVDTSIPDRLKKEKSGILNWQLSGYNSFKSRGLDDEPEVVKMATSDYKNDEDTFGYFVSDCLVEKQGKLIQTRDVFDAYVAWGGRLGTRNFDAAMSQAGHKKVRCRSGDLRGKNVYENITLSEDH